MTFTWLTVLSLIVLILSYRIRTLTKRVHQLELDKLTPLQLYRLIELSSTNDDWHKKYVDWDLGLNNEKPSNKGK